MKRLILSGVIVCLMMLVALPTRAYFEDRYFCTITDSVVSVSIAEGEKLCFSYLATITESIDILNEDIERANRYIDAGRDVTYWSSVRDDLSGKRDELANLRDQFITAVDDYEIELYLKVKAITMYYILPKREEALGKVDTAEQLLLRLKLSGDTETYPLVRRKLEELRVELALLERMREAGNFYQLIPALREYFRSPASTVEQDSIT